jgi:uncharacterized protein with von Willebrand factor type A (vWA) domain
VADPEGATASASDDHGRELLEVLVSFGHRLRAAGVVVGTGDVATFARAAALLNPADLGDLYWAGRVSLVSRREDLVVYDREFRVFFLGGSEEDPGRRVALAQHPHEDLRAAIEVPAADPPGDELREREQAELGLVGSGVQVLRAKAFADCTPEELAALRRLMAAIRLVPPRRRTRRHAPARRGHDLDARRTVREALRRHGELPPPRYRRRKLRPRRLVLILDVSGSMADYSRHLLQFAYSTLRAGKRVEVFCFGTRLTRITRQLDHRSPDEALARAARGVVDWEGGTRIGGCLDAFVRDWGRRGLSRGAVVVVCSDGLDRGDPALLARAMARLERLSHAIIWMNPHRGAAKGHVPQSVGMMIAEPHIDLVLSGHDLASLEEFAAALPRLG